jgi:hypothetical protein
MKQIRISFTAIGFFMRSTGALTIGFEMLLSKTYASQRYFHTDSARGF